MYCPRCGTEIEGHTKYCPTCGELLGSDVRDSVNPARNEGIAKGAARHINTVGTFFTNNVFRMMIAVIMLVIALLLIITFIDVWGLSFSSLSGLEKHAAAISTGIYVTTVFIPVLLSLESIRKSFFISANVNPKEFNIKRYAISKGALVPVIIDLLSCLAIAIVPLILYNYRQNDVIASLATVLGRYRTTAIICCLLCAISILLVAFSRKRIKQERVFQ